MKTALHFSIFLALLLWGTVVQSQCPCPLSGGCCGCGTALELYWVGGAGGSGDYNDPAMWRVGSPTGEIPCQRPRTMDNVYFLNVPNTATINVAAAAGNANCNNMTWTGTTAPTFTCPVGNIPLNITGNLILSSTMNFNYNSSVVFKKNTGVATITSNGALMRVSSLDFDGTGTFQLQDNLTLNAVSTNLRDGILDLNEKTLTCGRFLAHFDNRNTRGIML